MDPGPWTLELGGNASPSRVHAVHAHTKPKPSRRASRRASRGLSSVGKYETVSSSPSVSSRSAYTVWTPSAAFQLQCRFGLHESVVMREARASL